MALLLVGVRGQQPPPVDPAVEQAGEALLRAHAERSRGIRVLVAAYEQTRTTQLAREPLRSRGSFLFQRQPACVVFRATVPRESIVRLSSALYEVYRPQQKRLERFRLDGPELAQGLFAALGGDAEALRRDFVVAACGPDAAAADHTLVVLRPRGEAMQRHVRELRLSWHTRGGELAAVAYRDQAGDLVEIRLRDVVVNPPEPPSCEFTVAPGTTVVEHAARARNGQ
jgi:hypothetical protein